MAGYSLDRMPPPGSLPLRIGVWFDITHCCYGGPTGVLLGTLLGFFLQSDVPVCVVLNEPGDINWYVGGGWTLKDLVHRTGGRIVTGPISVFLGEETGYETNDIWKEAEHVLVPTEWVRHYICYGMPYHRQDLAGSRRISLWPAGVDTAFFSPDATSQKTQDFFIYYKSQKHADIHRILTFLFKRYFQLRGHIVPYYCYTPTMLRDAARSSRFCIVLNNTETQGLAMLEIMSCDCPLFVLDCKKFSGNRIEMSGASSAPCWSAECGVKSTWSTWETDFDAFLPHVESFHPRSFVESVYSYGAAASALIRLLGSRNRQECDHDGEKEDALNTNADKSRETVR